MQGHDNYCIIPLVWLLTNCPIERGLMGLVESQDRSHDMEQPITSRKAHDLKQGRERERGGGERESE